MPKPPRRSDDDDQLVLAGFEERTWRIFYKDRLHQVELLLPAGDKADALVLERTSAANDAARDADDKAEAQRRLHDALAEEVLADEPPSKPIASASISKKPGKLNVQAERTRLEIEYQIARDAHFSNGASAQVYAWDEPLRLIQDPEVKSPDREWHDRDRALYERLATKGSFRGLANQTDLPAIAQALHELRRTQPHFSQVIDLIVGQVRLAELKGTPLHLPPILLAGPPGVGKTHFTLELTKSMGRPLRRHNMDVSHTGASLMGSARNWANTHIGLVFEMVCLGDRADPLILLDELDKARRTDNADPIAPLHSLLEPLTATKVTDISAGIEFDASHIFWIATANELYRIPEPIKSRFRVFNISTPTAEQSIVLAQSVGQAVHERMSAREGAGELAEGGVAIDVFTPPSLRLYSLLAHLTPREQIQSLEQAYANALASGRRQVLRQDLPAEVLMDEESDTHRNGALH